MKYFIKTIYLVLLIATILSTNFKSFAKDISFKYSQDDISNYFSGIVSLSQNDPTGSFNYLSKIQSLKKKHSNYSTQFIRSLVLLEKFDEAFAFSKEIWSEDEFFFEADLLLGLQSYLKQDYKNAKKYFKRLNQISRNNVLFGDFFGNILLSWTAATENNQEASFEFLDEVPKRFKNLKLIQNSFLHCYFDIPKTEITFEKIIKKRDYSFIRYNFFLANYLISKKENLAAEILIRDVKNSNDSNLLIKQTLDFIERGKNKKITNFFDCKKPEDSIAEIFYVLANMYSTQQDFLMSNFYLKISLLLNSNFIPNKILLAENYFYQKKFENSKKVYKSIKRIGPVYSWFASRSIAIILAASGNKKDSISYLEKQFSKLSNLNFEHYYELANFYKDNEYYEESIKYYSLALENIKQGHRLIPKILDRRGTSYERNGNWEKAENDLLKSLKLLPDQPYVLNYLAYSWIEKKINIDEALEMLKEAARLKENDGYIIDSLGWAYYARKNYIEAEKFLQKAVELKPLDPIINDHYADSLWMLKKNIQASYVWRRVLTLDNTEQETKEKIKKKLIFGITNNL